MSDYPMLPFVVLHETHPMLARQKVDSSCLFVLDHDGCVYDDNICISPASRILSTHSIMPSNDGHGGRLNKLMLGDADTMYMVIHISQKTNMESRAQVFMKRCSFDTSLNLFYFAHILREYVRAHGTIPSPDAIPEYRETLRDLRNRNDVGKDPSEFLAYITALTTAILKAHFPPSASDLTMLARVFDFRNSTVANIIHVLPVDANSFAYHN